MATLNGSPIRAVGDGGPADSVMATGFARVRFDQVHNNCPISMCWCRACGRAV